MTVVPLDLDLVVNIEAGVFPREDLVDQFPADLLFPEQHLKDLVAEEGFPVSLRKDVKLSVSHEAAVGDKAMEVGMEVDQIPEGLDGDDGARYAFLWVLLFQIYFKEFAGAIILFTYGTEVLSTLLFLRTFDEGLLGIGVVLGVVMLVASLGLHVAIGKKSSI